MTRRRTSLVCDQLAVGWPLGWRVASTGYRATTGHIDVTATIDRRDGTCRVTVQHYSRELLTVSGSGPAAAAARAKSMLRDIAYHCLGAVAGEVVP